MEEERVKRVAAEENNDKLKQISNIQLTEIERLRGMLELKGQELGNDSRVAQLEE